MAGKGRSIGKPRENGRVNYAASSIMELFALSRTGFNFHLYKVQFRDEETLFPTSDGISDTAAFLYNVLQWSMKQKTRSRRRWGVAELTLDDAFESTIFFGQLVRLKKTRTIQFEEQGLKLGTEIIDDADTIAFVMDARNEYFLLQTSTQIPDDIALLKLRSFFNKADPRVRNNKRLYFEPINPNERAVERLRRIKIRKFTATVKIPNGEINKAFEKLLKPVSENTKADAVALTWESQKGLLNVLDGSAIDEAVTWAAEYGSWKAIPYEKTSQPIVSEETPLATRLQATGPAGIIIAARAFFSEIWDRLSGQRA